MQAKSPRFGARKIEQLMRTRGLPAALVAEALARTKGSEVERARAVWQRKFGSAPADATERARQQRFLASRGFEAETIRQVMRSAGSDGSLAADSVGD